MQSGWQPGLRVQWAYQQLSRLAGSDGKALDSWLDRVLTISDISEPFGD
jgi:hypothetical protein